MKKPIAKLLLAALAVTAPLLVRADLIWYEGFNYPDGNITNESSGIWVCPGGNNGSGTNLYVHDGRLEVSTSSSTIAKRDSDDYRFLSLTNDSVYTNSVQVLYASFTVICTNLPNGAGSYFAGFFNSRKGYVGRVLAFTNGTVSPKTWRLAVAGNSAATAPANGGYPADLALNTPYQVVVELDPVTLDAATLWINPLAMAQTGFSPTETHYTSSDSLGYATNTPVNSFAFRQAGSFGNGFWIITNLTLATTFAEAATNTWATNALPPVIVYQPVGVTNFTGTSITLSALANGQGLGNMTYQWQQNGQNYTGGNGGTANVLAISSAQTTDSGDFTLVATTPYGLSVTSSVAKVSISDAPVPPAFVTQPVSQTVYRGQNVTFSTAVVSSGNVTFTWYSNNVPVYHGVTSSSDSSTLELDKVTTDFAATYKVAVTNDVAANGVVSTNALLAVNNPAQVAIACLRSLVDPNNGYMPTNVPPSIPYQVTGTVTTFTNSAGGDAASYYLQDGTAGINIFVAGGSSFRPAQGDVVTFVGVLSGDAGGLELYADSADTLFPETSYTDTGATNALPAPINIGFDVLTNFNYANTSLAGSLVKLTDVYFGTNTGVVLPTAANYTGTVTNASGQAFKLSFFCLDLDTAGQTLPGYANSVTGVLDGINTNFSVVVTRFADIVTTPPSAPIPLGLTVSGRTLTFNWTNAAFLLQTATNVAGPYTTIPEAADGFSTNTPDGPVMFFRLYRP